MSEMETDEFAWVKARFECSPNNLDETLKLQIRGDVDTRKNLRPLNEPYGFRVETNGRRCSVIKEGNKIHDAVTFVCSEAAIEVRDKDEKIFITATVKINENGECRVFVGEKELKLWQLRMQALESLFFGR
jgi:hypothetical protein